MELLSKWRQEMHALFTNSAFSLQSTGRKSTLILFALDLEMKLLAPSASQRLGKSGP